MVEQSAGLARVNVDFFVLREATLFELAIQM